MRSIQKINNMRSHFYTGCHVKLKDNPNAVEIVYEILDINIYVDEKRTSILCDIRPIMNYPHPDGGYYSTNNIRESKVEELISVTY